MTRTLLAALLAAAALLGYVCFRQAAISRLDRQLLALQEKIALQQRLQDEITARRHLLGGRHDLAAFVESLYAGARHAALADHQVTTSRQQDAAQPRPTRRGAARGESAALKTSRLQVLLHGDYRSVAEYLRTVDGIAGPKQISYLEMTAEGAAIRAQLLIDLYSLEGRDVRRR